MPCDLARDTSVLGLFETVLGRFGRLDMLVNNAAVSFGGDLDIEMKRYDVVMRVNVRAPLMTSRIARPYLGRASDGGRILNVGASTSTAYLPDADHSTWADPVAAADGAVWMLDRPVDWTGRIVSMLELAEHVPSIAELGRAPFELPGPWAITGARRDPDRP